MGADPGLFASPAPRRRRRLALIVIERVLLVVGLSALGYVAGTMGGAALYQDYELRQLDAVLQSGTRAGAPTSAPAAPRRTVLGRIDIPRLRVSTIVKEGDDARTLQLAVGHIRGTALPGAAGNMGLAGHRDTFFRSLEAIEVGDVIRLVAPEGTFTYAVEHTRVVEPDDVWVLDPTPEPVLTLVTCFPFTYVGSAPQRFIVRARLIPEPPLDAAVQPVRLRSADRAQSPARTARSRAAIHETAAPRSRVVAPARRTTRDDAPTVAAPVKPQKPRPIVWLHTVPRGH